jgi:hypothetical protein
MAKTRNQEQDPPLPPTRKRKSKKDSTSSSQPPPPSPPPPIQPPYNRFVSQEAEDRYNVIRKCVFTKERGFDFENLSCYPNFEQKIHEKQWEGIVGMVTPESNQSIALEFLANAFVEGSTGRHAMVRGKQVDYAPSDIARVLGLPRPEECEVMRKRKKQSGESTKEQWDALLAGLMGEGTGWKGHGGRPQRIDAVDLLPEYKAWASFILTTIERTSAKAEMTCARVYILLALLSDKEIDAGSLMYHSLKELITTTRATLGHCCLINALCRDAHVPTESSHVFLTSQQPISNKVMLKFEKDQEEFERGLAQQEGQQGQPQMMKEDQVPQMQPQMRSTLMLWPTGSRRFLLETGCHHQPSRSCFWSKLHVIVRVLSPG